MAQVWERKCDNCDNKQVDTQPDNRKELPMSYTERKCKKCKSASLDYGSSRHIHDGDCATCSRCHVCLHDCMCEDYD